MLFNARKLFLRRKGWLSKCKEEEMNRESDDEKNIYGDPFYYDAPFHRHGMPAEEYRREREYLNENIDIFIDGSYVPLWKQEKMRQRRKAMKGSMYERNR